MPLSSLAPEPAAFVAAVSPLSPCAANQCQPLHHQLIIDVAASNHPAYDPVTTVSPLKDLPHTIGQLSNLQQLVLRGCNALTILPDSVGDLSSLTLLELEGCHSLRELPGSLGQLQALRSLQIEGANNLEVRAR
jgi:Leucine-rich repeat (LRR) protein